MEELVRKIYAQWRAAIERVGQECDDRSLHNLADKYRRCRLFKGTEDMAGLVELLTSPQGAEFCLTYGFPNPATFRLFTPYHPERYGIYIDAGEITLKNPERAFFVGRTNARVDCDTLARHRLFLMHGATAAIYASGWAVVSLHKAKGCQVISRASGNAVIL